MSMENTGCAPVTAIKASVIGRGRIFRLGLALGAALLVAAAPPTDDPKPDPSFPFSNEIEAFARANNAGPRLADATLFIGSSSIRLWDIAASFPDDSIVNRGFGGATTADVLHYYKRLLPPGPPSRVIVYVGENDLATGATPERIARDILTLLGRLRADYPRARIAFLSLKPSPIRWTLWPRMAEVNGIVAARAGRDFDYVDVGAVLLAPDGLPNAQLFRPDGLHMNPRGYARWTRLVDAWLDARPIPKTAAASLVKTPVVRSTLTP
jgi:lysophospholipase L1-like esterase